MKFNLKLIGLFLIGLITFACTQPTQESSKTANSNATTSNTSQSAGEKKIKIGFAMDTLKEERWQRDKDAFEAHCKKLNVDCFISVADNKKEKQATDVEQLLTQKIDVLVIAPSDATQAASIVDKAKAEGVPVISYDRLINSDKLDVYISHQVPVIGKKIAEYALQKVPKGNYIMVYGASTDNNAVIMKDEMMKVLKPSIDKGDIKLIQDQFTEGWKPEKALENVENALTKNNNDVQAVVASNDGTAGGAIQALEKQGLAGKVLVTGQDAQLDALQRIAEGKQTMTIYKPIIPLANAAVETAIKLAKKESLTDAKDFTAKISDKDLTVKAILLDITVVDKDNLMSTVIKDGYAKFDDVYKNVPAEQRPKQ